VEVLGEARGSDTCAVEADAYVAALLLAARGITGGEEGKGGVTHGRVMAKSSSYSISGKSPWLTNSWLWICRDTCIKAATAASCCSSAGVSL